MSTLLQISTKVIKPLHSDNPYFWSDMAIFGESLDDAEKARIALDNRVRAGSANDPRIGIIISTTKQNERAMEKGLISLFKESGFRDFEKRHRGLGAKSLARILGRLGDPYVATPKFKVDNPKYNPNKPSGKNNPKTILVAGEPYIRSVAQLWAYCGHGAALRRAKGMNQEDAMALGDPRLKSLVFIAADCAMKQKPKDLSRRSIFRALYDDRREETRGRIHAENCIRCGPSGKPALAGSPWSDKHAHCDSLRIMGKEILKQLWLEARALHESGEYT